MMARLSSGFIGALQVILSAVAARHEARVVGRRRGHAEYFAGRRLDGHYGAELSLEQPFGKTLQIHVDAEGDVLAGHGGFVILSVLVAALRAAVYIAQHDAHSFLAAQFFLVGTLHAELAYVVAALIVAVFGDVGVAYLAHIAQYVGGYAGSVAAYGTFLHGESAETVELLAQHGELLGGYLGHEELRRIAGIGGPRLDFRHLPYVVFGREAHHFAELESVDAYLVVHDDHDIVRGLVVYEQAALAVENEAARGKLYVFAEGVGVGVLLVIVAHQLQCEETQQVDDDHYDDDAGNHKLPVGEIHFTGHIGRL